MASIKTAVLGVGGMGNGVAAHLKKNPNVSGVVAYDIKPEQAKKCAERNGISSTADLNEILRDPEIKAVFVTASNAAHLDLSVAALEAGKAVMCEKPMANTLEDALKMVETAERTKGFLQIGFELRYSKMYTIVKDWIDAGLLGDVINCNCTYICSEFHGVGSWRNKKETGGSMFGEKLCHYVDLPRWWVGPEVAVDTVYSACAPNVVPYYEVHDNYNTTYRFANGAIGNVCFMMALGAKFKGDPLQNVISQQKGDGHQLTFLVQGTKGAASTDIFNRTIKRWSFENKPEGFISSWEENLTWEAAEDEHYFHSVPDQTDDIVRRVIAGEPPKTTARDSYETMRLVFAAEISADENRLVKMSEIK